MVYTVRATKKQWHVDRNGKLVGNRWTRMVPKRAGGNKSGERNCGRIPITKVPSLLAEEVVEERSRDKTLQPTDPIRTDGKADATFQEQRVEIRFNGGRKFGPFCCCGP